MKKIININLASRLIPIEDSAYEILRQYLDSLKKYFAREEGADEIVSDIEGRIAEIFQDKIKKGAHCITDDDVVGVKAVMGTPDQFEETDDTNAKQQSAPASDPIYDSFRTRKRLYRDPDAKVLGGVCGGLGAYLNVDPVVFRIIFALLAIGGFGSGILVYFILWIVTPEANSAAEKLQMRGERVDVNNIKTAVQDEINATKAHFKHIGNEMRNFSQGRGRQVGNDIERFGRSFFDVLGRVLIVLTKGFFYFLAVVILLVLLVVGVMITVASPVLLPFKDLLLSGTLQNLLFWPSVFLLIGIPIVGIIIFIIRKLTGVKQTNRYVGYTLSFLWFTGLVFAILVGISVAKDFRLRNTVKENFAIVQPSKGKIVFKEAENLVQVEESFFDENLRLADDTVIINNYHISVEKSRNDSFYLEVQRSARGRSISQARTLAKEISYPITQQDTVIYLPAGISIPRDSKFRDQRVRLIIRVPVDKQVEMDKKVRNHYRNWNWDNDWNDHHDWDDFEDNGDDSGQVLKMTTDGIDQKNDKHESNNDSSEDNYRYKGKQERKTSPEEDTTKATSATGKGKVAFEGGEAISYSLYKLLS
ncbi:PspC domain-containing protein [Chitinophaga sancti]|uniref:Phage shock protein C (PspC) family protein n=1 Tax=Chitinophaga sancti TaxID=1004 RepID=A0A1K1SXM1_9BACT|nr:PspC domain-containing protein [Chitinophaga sancti]WQD60490.1 PspC domain-containing protein [Chitinophaga sancti]WQG87383.1 PspC domain-containing protein [Chitinophaga sancti]SFW89136.1 phage shock protein C (PspC) family protein [Chitinophaga sancti]